MPYRCGESPLTALCHCGALLLGPDELRYGLCVFCQSRLIAEKGVRHYPVHDCELITGTFERKYCGCGRELITPQQLCAGRCECCTVEVML
jgi:hypothetical protein